MSTDVASAPRPPRDAFIGGGKLITCILADNGADVELLKALRAEKGIVAASSLACRGMGAGGVRLGRRRRPRAEPVRLVSVVVPEERADEIFEFIYVQVDIEGIGGGLIYQSPLRLFTPFALPEGVEDET